MIRTVIWFIYFVLHLVYTLPQMLYAKYLDARGKMAERDKVARSAAITWSRCLVSLAGAKVTVKGGENIPKDKPVVFIGNHQGNFDIPLLLGYVGKPMGFISKIEMTKIPVISTWMKYLHCVFMDRNDIRQSITAINTGIESIKNGNSIIIFPEGTRSRSNNVGEFKQGSFKLATKSGAPIVPITMKGTYKLFEENKGRITPAKVEIIISEPIETKDLNPQELKELPDKVRDIIISKLS